MERVVCHRDEWTTKANEMSLQDLCVEIKNNLQAHGYSTDNEIKEILSYVRVFYERYNGNLERVMAKKEPTIEEFDRAWDGTTPIEEEQGK
jgi:hypothetical protein